MQVAEHSMLVAVQLLGQYSSWGSTALGKVFGHAATQHAAPRCVTGGFTIVDGVLM